jgi:hypothetical protein
MTRPLALSFVIVLPQNEQVIQGDRPLVRCDLLERVLLLWAVVAAAAFALAAFLASRLPPRPRASAP